MNCRIPINHDSTAIHLAQRLGILLSRQKLSLAVAESCTGGMIGAAITAIAGSSAYFKGGVIAYDNEIKHAILGVPRRILDEKGAVSAETVKAMATGVCKLIGADCAIAISGVAGPGGGTQKKPVGLVYVGIRAGKKARCIEYFLRGNRKEIRRKSVLRALKTMIDVLS